MIFNTETEARQAARTGSLIDQSEPWFAYPRRGGTWGALPREEWFNDHEEIHYAYSYRYKAGVEERLKKV